MSAHNDGGPAFPMQDAQAIHAYAAGRVADIPGAEADRRDREYMRARSDAVGGMSLRDYFAANALMGMLADLPKSCYGLDWKQNVAREAWGLADAMLAERDKATA